MMASYRFVLCMLFVSMVAFVALPVSGEANQFRRIQDANVACTGNLRCDLFFANPRATLSRIGFRRSPAPDAPVHLFMSTRQSFAPGSQIQFSVDGRIVGSLDVSDLSYRAAVYEYTSRDEALVSALMSASRNGAELQVDYQTRSGRTTAAFRLAGIGDGLAAMDEAQGRTGRVDALETRNQAAPSTGEGEIEGFAQLDRFNDVPLAIRVRFFAGTQSRCSGLTSDQRDRLGGIRLQLSDFALYGLPCGAPSSINTDYALFELRDGDVRQLAFPVVDDGLVTTRSTVSNLTFNAATRLVFALHRDRADDSCGRLDSWRVVGEGEAALALVEARQQDDCNGDTLISPQNWPQVWPDVAN